MVSVKKRRRLLNQTLAESIGLELTVSRNLQCVQLICGGAASGALGFMDIRTLGLGLGVFCATFVVGWWLNIGTFAYGIWYARPATVAVPVMVSATPAPVAQAVAAPQAKPAQPRLPRVKSAQGKDLSQGPQGNAAPKPGTRIRRR
jgi:hypothetical protein